MAAQLAGMDSSEPSTTGSSPTRDVDGDAPPGSGRSTAESAAASCARALASCNEGVRGVGAWTMRAAELLGACRGSVLA
jgi:hypothetical protein